MNQVFVDIKNWFEQIDAESIVHIVIAIGIIVGFKIFSSLFSYIIIKLCNVKEKDRKKIKNNPFYKPLKLFFTCSGIYIAILVLKLPDSIVGITTRIFKIITILLVANGFANILKPDSHLFQKLKDTERLKGNEGILKFFSKVISVIIYTVAAFMIIYELGYDLNGIVAGLGLGSVVVALAVQDIAKSMFAGLIIFLDRPFAIGDYVQFQNYEGTVEDISFRSTRIRLITNSVLTVPNQILETESIINWSRIEKRRYSTNLGLRLNTPMNTVEKVTEQMKEMLEKMPHVIENTVEVHFTDITEDSMLISIYLYTDIIVYNEYLSWRQEINLLLMHILEENQAQLAYKSQEIYLRNS